VRLPADAIGTEASSSDYSVIKWEDGHLVAQDDVVAEEVPIAMVYNGVSHVVMLATPQDLEDFAVGFSLSEGIITSAEDIYGIEINPQPKGIELLIELAADRFFMLKERRRNLTGRTGCGLCGAESLEQALRIPENVIGNTESFEHGAIVAAHHHIRDQQKLQAVTGATHACAWVRPDGEVELIREDVGRHNALDKLIGARARMQANSKGFVLTTSRASYEMVQKTAAAGVPMLVAVSAPTGLAIRIASSCGLTLVGFARKQQYVIYSHPERILHKEYA
jgi:FdhD protein